MEEQYLEMLRQTQADSSSDPETWHVDAEGVMLAFLREAGFGRFADEYLTQSENWWYA